MQDISERTQFASIEVEASGLSVHRPPFRFICLHLDCMQASTEVWSGNLRKV